MSKELSEMCPLGEKMAKIWLKLQENGEKKSQMAKVMAKEKYILARTLWRKRFLKVFAIYSHGSHLGHVTLTIYIYFHTHFLTILLIKFGFDWPSSFREKDL